MHKLLERQLRKLLPSEIAKAPEMQAFLHAVNRSYRNNDEKLEMMQRSTTLSSAELSNLNTQLFKKIESQKKIFASLSKVVQVMDKTQEKLVINHDDVDPIKLAASIEEKMDKILELTTEKNDLLKDLEEQNDSLNNYAHMVSHDLKSPIRNMHTLISWIVEEECHKFSEESKTNCALVSQNLTKVDALIDGILRHATLEKHEEEKTNISIGDLIEEIKNTIFIPDNIQILTKGNLPKVYKDKYKLEHLFRNLLSNAIRATEGVVNGKIIISATDKEEYWEFCVKDTGKGIPLKYQESIFNMFKKLENNTNATGIGLALVKKIVHIYKGEIWLESQLEKGSSFYFTIKK